MVGEEHGVVDEWDRSFFDDALKKYDPAFDYNEDGKVDKKVDEPLFEAAQEQSRIREDQ